MTDPSREPATAATLRPDPASLQEVPFFAGLGLQALADLVRLGHTQRLPKESVLFERGAEASALHLLLQGRLKVVQAAPDGRQIVLRYVGPQELAGVYALLGAGQRYPATVSAVVDSVLLSWDRVALGVILERYPQLALNAMRTLGHRAQEAHERLREASADRVERRLALTLLRLLRQAGTREPDGAVSIGFPPRPPGPRGDGRHDPAYGQPHPERLGACRHPVWRPHAGHGAEPASAGADRRRLTR